LRVRVGIFLPVFREDADTAIDAARRADGGGLDGVFVFDHLFPAGQPERPALSAVPMLGAIAAETARISLGPLVSRVGVLPDDVLINGLLTVQRLAGSRLIAALGTGDRRSLPEHELFSLPFLTVDERLQKLVHCCRALREHGVTVWLGGKSEAVAAVAAAEADALNIWGGTVEQLAARRRGLPDRLDLTWAGPPPDGVAAMSDHLRRVQTAGATWAVYAPPAASTWPAAVEMVIEAANTRD
jgi:alkanesulfonate monooxygenase SsuD/methylene tetrahydromethanopterin reductase-like flavin-dependent oxidoreductase (luciferase family)